MRRRILILTTCAIRGVKIKLLIIVARDIRLRLRAWGCTRTVWGCGRRRLHYWYGGLQLAGGCEFVDTQTYVAVLGRPEASCIWLADEKRACILCCAQFERETNVGTKLSSSTGSICLFRRIYKLVKLLYLLHAKQHLIISCMHVRAQVRRLRQTSTLCANSNLINPSFPLFPMN